ncbi:hypothetical protein Tco_0941082 [Tanacetum coccineum]|uniref:Reverse transcriptase Ty1/copia-type domain-containing protein n=1 Tax=Tanacetum coccineum TaxID=301880 RepID=A0ABQ5DQ16_9ASTR
MVSTSPSFSQTIPEAQYLVISNDVEEENQDLDVAHMNNNPFFGIPIPENNSEASSSSNVIPTIVHTATPNSEHVTKWTKDHPLDNIIGELERPVSTRLQLHEQAIFFWNVVPYPEKVLGSYFKMDLQGNLMNWRNLKKKCSLVTPCLPSRRRIWILRNPCASARLDAIRMFFANDAHKNISSTSFLRRHSRTHSAAKKFVIQLSGEFSKGTVDPTLFIRRQGKDILLIKIYVDDIIFATKYFTKSQSHRVIFLNQSKYALESLKKYGMESSDPVDTPMVEKSKLDEDPQEESHDTYTLMWNAKPTKKHLHAVKRIFKYLRGTINRGLWYLRNSSIALTAYADAESWQVAKMLTNPMDENHSLLTMALDSIKFQCTVITKELLPYAATIVSSSGHLRLRPLGEKEIEFHINKLGSEVLPEETQNNWSDESCRIVCQNWRDLPRDIPLDSVVVLRYEKRSKSKNKGKVSTEMELVLEQNKVDPHGFKGYSNQTRANDKAIFVPLLLTVLMHDT